MLSLYLVILSIDVLVIPSMQHRLVEAGRSSLRLISATGFWLYSRRGSAPQRHADHIPLTTLAASALPHLHSPKGPHCCGTLQAARRKDFT
jgi:hypothetical protein